MSIVLGFNLSRGKNNISTKSYNYPILEVKRIKSFIPLFTSQVGRSASCITISSRISALTGILTLAPILLAQEAGV